MSSLVRTDAKEMLYEAAPCQRMADKEIGDCGVLAIAFATSIAHPSRNFESKNRQKKKMHLKSVLNAFVFH